MSENTISNVPNAGGQDNDEASLLDLLQIIVDNIKFLVFWPCVCGLVALVISFAITPTFTAKTQFLPPQHQQSAAVSMLASLGSLSGLAGVATGLKNPSDQYVAFIKSVSVQDALIDRFNLLERYGVKLRTDARLELIASVNISSGKDGLIIIEVDDKEPKFASDLANAHVEELGILLGRLATTEAQHRRKFFEKQLELTKDKLTKAEWKLRSSGINRSVLMSSPVSAVEAVARLKAGISVQEVKLGNMRSYLTENSPEFKQALSELNSIKAQLSRAEKEEPTIHGSSDYVSNYREFKYQEAMFDLLAKQFELAKIDESREGAVIQVLDVAEPPEKKVKPKKTLIVMFATLSSGFALLLFVLLRSSYKNSFKDEKTRHRINAIKTSWKNALRRRY